MVAVPSIGRATAVTPRPAAPEADATRDLYERHGRQILHYCINQLGNRQEAEDATQTTFLNAFRGFQRGIEPEFESAWLFKIAHNVCLTRQRSSYRRRRVESPSDLDALQDMLASPQKDTDELIRLTEALHGMPEQQRRALLLREWQGLTYKEIGEEMDLSQAAVETLLFRARRSLATGLTEEVPAKGLRKRLRAGGDAGSLMAAIKMFFFSGGAKLAATVATVVASSVVAATPAARHAVEQAVAPAKASAAATHAQAPRAAAPAALVVSEVRRADVPFSGAQPAAPVAHDPSLRAALRSSKPLIATRNEARSSRRRSAPVDASAPVAAAPSVQAGAPAPEAPSAPAPVAPVPAAVADPAPVAPAHKDAPAPTPPAPAATPPVKRAPDGWITNGAEKSDGKHEPAKDEQPKAQQSNDRNAKTPRPAAKDDGKREQPPVQEQPKEPQPVAKENGKHEQPPVKEQPKEPQPVGKDDGKHDQQPPPAAQPSPPAGASGQPKKDDSPPPGQAKKDAPAPTPAPAPAPSAPAPVSVPAAAAPVVVPPGQAKKEAPAPVAAPITAVAAAPPSVVSGQPAGNEKSDNGKGDGGKKGK